MHEHEIQNQPPGTPVPVNKRMDVFKLYRNNINSITAFSKDIVPIETERAI